MARLTELTPQLQQEIGAAWAATMPRMFDVERSMQALIIPIAEENNTQWYSLPNGNFMILRNAIVGGSASLQFLTLADETIPELESAREQLVDAVKQYQLKRITVTYPTVLPWRDFKLLGFKHEGRIRQSVLFNGEWIDAEILGALDNEIGISRRRRRKRYRAKNQENIDARTTERFTLPSARAGTADSRPERASDSPNTAIGPDPRERTSL